MNALELASATAADLDEIAALLQRSGLPTAGLTEHLAEGVVARRGAALVGSAGLEMYPDGALLRSVAVDAAERGTGLGQRLTAFALARARARRASAVYLLTTTAQGFFPRFGFSEVERANVPESLRRSIEFASACPASATVMHLVLDSAGVSVRDARAEDVPSIRAIFNDVLETSTAIYMEEPVTLDNRMAWWRGRVEAGFPVLVAEDHSGIVGFGSFGDFRAPYAYRFTVEHSVHVRADSRGRGVGGTLVKELIQRATALGKHVMIAGVDAENSASLRFHERLGFERVAHFRQVGFKFNRWLDLVFLQRNLRQ